MKLKKYKLFICTVLILFMLMSCSSIDSILDQVGAKKPSVKITGLKLTALSFEKMDLLFDIQINNPNNFGIQLSGFDYQLTANQRELLNGKQDKTISIPSANTETIQIPATLSSTELIKLVKDLVAQDSLPCSLSAGFDFNLPVLGSVRIPAEFQTNLPVLKTPVVSVQSIKLDRLNLDGADFIVKLNIINQNPFHLDILSCEYQLSVKNSSWINGEIFKPLTVSEKAERLLPVGIHLNLVEMGKTLYRELGNDAPMDYMIKGHLKFSTPVALLKSVSLSFNNSGTISFGEK